MSSCILATPAPEKASTRRQQSKIVNLYSPSCVPHLTQQGQGGDEPQNPPSRSTHKRRRKHDSDEGRRQTKHRAQKQHTSRRGGAEGAEEGGCAKRTDLIASRCLLRRGRRGNLKGEDLSAFRCHRRQARRSGARRTPGPVRCGGCESGLQQSNTRQSPRRLDRPDHRNRHATSTAPTPRSPPPPHIDRPDRHADGLYRHAASTHPPASTTPGGQRTGTTFAKLRAGEAGLAERDAACRGVGMEAPIHCVPGLDAKVVLGSALRRPTWASQKRSLPTCNIIAALRAQRTAQQRRAPMCPPHVFCLTSSILIAPCSPTC